MNTSANTVYQNSNLNNIANQSIPDINSIFGKIADISSANTAQSRLMAEEQRKWQERMTMSANAFSAAEAAKARDWQAYMSNTAHQREVADLKAAGLNPVLSATGGQGAYVGSAATAHAVTGQGTKGDVDTSANAAIVGMLSSMLSAQTKIAETTTNALTNMAVADKYTSMNEIVANIAAQAQRDSASIYGQTSRDVESMREAHDRYIHENYPSNMYQAVSAILGLFGDSPKGNVENAIGKIGETIGKVGETIGKLEVNPMTGGISLDIEKLLGKEFVDRYKDIKHYLKTGHWPGGGRR